MKTLSKLTVAAGLLSGALLAQRPYGTAASPPDPATMAQHQVDRLTSLLSLTATQVSQATAIFTNATTTITPLRTTLHGYFDAMQTAVKGNATDTIDQLAVSMGTTMGQITAIQNKANAAFYLILTATQQATLSANPRALGGPGFGGPGPGGPPPGPPPGGDGQ